MNCTLYAVKLEKINKTKMFQELGPGTLGKKNMKKKQVKGHQLGNRFHQPPN